MQLIRSTRVFPRNRYSPGLGVLSAVLTIPALIYAVHAWKDSYGGLGSRLSYTLITIAALALVWFLNDSSLLGWRY